MNWKIFLIEYLMEIKQRRFEKNYEIHTKDFLIIFCYIGVFILIVKFCLRYFYYDIFINHIDYFFKKPL